MDWVKQADTIVAIASLFMIASGAILYFSQSGLHLVSEIIVVVGFILLVIDAFGGQEGEKKRPNKVTPGKGWNG